MSGIQQRRRSSSVGEDEEEEDNAEEAVDYDEDYEEKKELLDGWLRTKYQLNDLPL